MSCRLLLGAADWSVAPTELPAVVGVECQGGVGQAGLDDIPSELDRVHDVHATNITVLAGATTEVPTITDMVHVEGLGEFEFLGDIVAVARDWTILKKPPRLVVIWRRSRPRRSWPRRSRSSLESPPRRDP